MKVPEYLRKKIMRRAKLATEFNQVQTSGGARMNIIHCENCRFWQDGYCTLRKKETCDGATCDKAEEY